MCLQCFRLAIEQKGIHNIAIAKAIIAQAGIAKGVSAQAGITNNKKKLTNHSL